MLTLPLCFTKGKCGKCPQQPICPFGTKPLVSILSTLIKPLHNPREIQIRKWVSSPAHFTVLVFSLGLNLTLPSCVHLSKVFFFFFLDQSKVFINKSVKTGVHLNLCPMQEGIFHFLQLSYPKSPLKTGARNFIQEDRLRTQHCIQPRWVSHSLTVESKTNFLWETQDRLEGR